MDPSTTSNITNQVSYKYDLPLPTWMGRDLFWDLVVRFYCLPPLDILRSISIHSSLLCLVRKFSWHWHMLLYKLMKHFLLASLSQYKCLFQLQCSYIRHWNDGVAVDRAHVDYTLVQLWEAYASCQLIIENSTKYFAPKTLRYLIPIIYLFLVKTDHFLQWIEAVVCCFFQWIGVPLQQIMKYFTVKMISSTKSCSSQKGLGNKSTDFSLQTQSMPFEDKLLIRWNCK